MSRRKKPTEEPEETPPEPSRAAGGCVLAVLVLGLGAVLFAALGSVAVLVVWAAGGVALWRTVRSVPSAANPAPPGPSERGSNTSPQFTVVEDRPGHCTVNWSKGATE
ncbi:hypothetical protein YW5DRAFT_01911 [Streptomyces sp. Ncost-T6T-1]|uniref:hypothetical protein n=1 Tax=Streptomyces sp. Ncost-T6T-1 TaxID=1100828 RepID=UPI0008056CCB|nr:hypothetical protein [Streptomyces sp. Ncost-T6T-1]SBV00582.1 hypothetical protein YW5DRAFT_01911 [Streptomyces sp. Ncost-T6T-1]